jgi:hypothetical protein
MKIDLVISSHMCSIQFMYGATAGHSKTLTYFVQGIAWYHEQCEALRCRAETSRIH